MSESCGYLVPDKSFEIGEFAKQVKIILDGLEITKGFYDTEGTLAAGPSSFLIFSETPNNSPIAFGYAKIHDSVNLRLVPEEFDVGANCVKCKQSVDESFFEALSTLYEQEYDNDIETDVAQLEIACENCGYSNKLTDIGFDHDTEVKNQYIIFDNIEAYFDIKMVQEIGKKLGCNLKALYGRF